MEEAVIAYTDADKIADAILAEKGPELTLALPLGLGKGCHIANALVRRALDDSSIKLHIFTALTLEPPQIRNDLQRKFMEPAQKRLFGDYPELLYARHLRDGTLPGNITVNEFFLLAGQWLGNGQMQKNYIPANYTHVLPYLLDIGVDVVAQLVARDGDRYSLSCNPDIMADMLKARKDGRADFILAAQVNSELPFMYGEAVVDKAELDFILESEDTDFQLFSAPKRPVRMAEQAIGIHAARLVRDGGTLQIGIGSISDAITKAMILRHEDNAEFRKLVGALNFRQADDVCEDGPFDQGIYGVSEMFVGGFVHLYEHGILTREVDGAVLHGAFFLDSRSFYKHMREMKEADRKRFKMMPVSFTNALYGDEAEKRDARVKASFINNAMMATLRGAVVSDALEDGRVVSGVGGQFNFVEQAFALDDARNIITLNATRKSRGKVVSNIVWSYGHETVPWHMRDIIVTEYGIARLRGKSEQDAIKEMLSIADSRFQDDLLQQAKAAGKVDKNWQLPGEWRNNTPERIAAALKPARDNGLLPMFPYGTDFTATEQRLMPALAMMKNSAGSKRAMAGLFLSGLSGDELRPDENACLERMALNKPRNIRDYLYKTFLKAALLRTRDTHGKETRNL